jgi:H+/Cl- antiporter ClcA
VFGAVALVTGLVTAFASYFIGQAILSSQHINSTLGQPGVLRAVVGGGLFSRSAGCSRSAWAPCCGTPPGRSLPRSRCCSCCSC